MTNLKDKIKIGLAGLVLAGGLIFSGCGDNKKYQDFAEFVIKEGSIDSDGNSRSFSLLKDNKEYWVSLYSPEVFGKERIVIDVSNKVSIEEKFEDDNLNGLDFYISGFDGKIVVDPFSLSQSKKNKEKYDSLIINLPKWHAESKKAERKLSAEKKLSECSCPEMGGASKLELIGCYDIDKDGDLDCIYKQDSTQKIFLYENYRNGNAFRLAGEFHKKN